MPPLIREDRDKDRFRSVVEPHLDAAFNLARWMVRNVDDAQDLVQEACLRALRYFGTYRGGDPRSWLLAIVRNTCFTWLEAKQAIKSVEYDEDIEGHQLHEDQALLHGSDPEQLVLREAGEAQLEVAMLRLPAHLREVLVLRELEELSYKQIASISDVPIGTVMSRLARARARLQEVLVAMETNP